MTRTMTSKAPGSGTSISSILKASELLVRGPLDDGVLEGVDLLVDVVHDREEGVGQRVDDLVDDELLGHVVALPQTDAQVVEFRAGIVVHGDDEIAVQEQV